MIFRGMRCNQYLALLVSAVVLIGCGEDSGPDDPFPAPAAGEGFQMKATVLAPAGTEIWKCIVYDLPTDNWEMVNRVESFQSEGMHHMDVMALAFTNVNLEPGEYDCDDLYTEHNALMEDGVFLYAAQAEEQFIQLPDGVAANLPPGIRVMHEIHYVNTSDQDIDVYSYINAYTIDPATVTDTIWGNAVRDVNINIPPGDGHVEWTRCVMSEDIDLLFLSSHTHQLGREVRIRLFDGTGVGEEIYMNDDWQTPFLKSFGPEALHIPAGTGFEFSCTFNNFTSEMVNWGFEASDEMCQIALVFTPGEASRECMPVASSDDLHDKPTP